MRASRRRSLFSTLCVGAAVLLGYSAFAWVETTRGLQVYPGKSLWAFIAVCGAIGLVSLAGAGLVLFTKPGDMVGERVGPSEPGVVRGAGGVWSAPWLLAMIIMAVAFTAFAVNHSRQQGRLAFPPFYDDVQYLDDGLGRLHVLNDNGAWGFVQDYWTRPPHAPTNTMLAMAGYGLFGTEDWAPPFMNALVVLSVLLFVRWTTRGLPWLWSTAVLGFALAWPFVFLSVVHFIPDFHTAAATAIAALLMVTSGPGRRPSMEYLSGALFGLALLAKPAMFPVTGFILAAIVLVSLAIEFTYHGMRGVLTRGVKAQVRLSGACLAVCGPHYAANYKAVWGYIQVNTWGSASDLWKMKGGLAEQLLYHVTGPGGQYSVGPFLWIVPVIALLALVVSVRRRRPVLAYVLPWLAVFLFGHAVVSVTSYKSVFLGTFVSAFIFVTTIALLAECIRGFREVRPVLRVRVGLIACLAVVVAGVLFFRPQPMVTILVHVFQPYPRAGPEFIREAAVRRRLVDRVNERVRESGRLEATVGVVRGNLYCVPAVFSFQMKKDRTRRVRFVDASSYGSSEEAFAKEIAPLDFVMYLMPHAHSAEAQSRVEAQFLEQLNRRDRWRILDRIPCDFDQATAIILEKVLDSSSVSLEMAGVSGFSPPEGPYAPANFRVRWALGPGAVIPFVASGRERLTLEMEVLAMLPGQSVTVLLDGSARGSFPIPPGDSVSGYTTIRVPLNVSEGSHRLELRFADWVKAPDQRPVAALYRKIVLKKE